MFGQGIKLALLGVALTLGSTWVLGSQQEQGFLALKDGRIVLGPAMTANQAGVVIHFVHGDIFVTHAAIDNVLPTKWDGIVEPQRTAEDQEKIRQGRVPVQGKWVTRASLQLRHRTAAGPEGDNEYRTASGDDRLAWERRKRRETKYFNFEYTVTDVRLDRFVEYMDLFFEHVLRVLKADPPRGERMRVSFFHSDRLMYQVIHSNVNQYDLYWTGAMEAGLHFSDDPLDESHTLRTIRVGLTNYALVVLAPKLEYPPWIVESLADYFATVELTDGGRKFDEGKLQVDQIERIRRDIAAGHSQRLHDIIACESFLGMEQAPWAWSLTHFLMQNPKLRSRYVSFLAQMAYGRGVRREGWGTFLRVPKEETIRLLCEELKLEDLAAVERTWMEWIAGLDSPKSQAELLDAGQLAFLCGNWLSAVELLERVSETMRSSPEFLLQLGQARLMSGNSTGARECLEEALALDPLSARAFYWLSRVEMSENTADKDELARREALLAAEIARGDENLARAVAEVLEMLDERARDRK